MADLAVEIDAERGAQRPGGGAHHRLEGLGAHEVALADIVEGIEAEGDVEAGRGEGAQDHGGDLAGEGRRRQAAGAEDQHDHARGIDPAPAEAADQQRNDEAGAEAGDADGEIGQADIAGLMQDRIGLQRDEGGQGRAGEGFQREHQSEDGDAWLRHPAQPNRLFRRHRHAEPDTNPSRPLSLQRPLVQVMA